MSFVFASCLCFFVLFEVAHVLIMARGHDDDDDSALLKCVVASNSTRS